VRVWIDLSNSPHPLLFAPVSRRLQAEGHEVLITARDNAQTVELARERWPNVDVIGEESPRGRARKLAAIGGRMGALARWAVAHRPDVALSHNSYAQIVAARVRRVPVVTAMDFEHQPANHLAFRLARTVVVPELLPLDSLRRQGLVPSRIVRYPGLKEELYIGDFEPDPTILGKLGIEPRPRTVVVVRTPPSRAVYHPAENPLFAESLRVACNQESVVCVALARHREQVTMIRSLGLPNCVIPGKAIDSRSLMYAADVMIGAGGTMTREAALIGIPTWTLFAGETPAVDMWLERQGRLVRLTDPGQLTRLTPRQSKPLAPDELRRRAGEIEQVFVDATLRGG
jgi:predicted glycosyltransferase